MTLTKHAAALAALLIPFGLASAATSPATAEKETVYTVDTAESRIEWIGRKVTGRHNGTIAIQEGTLRVADGRVVGGRFIIDMTSINVEDLEGAYKEKLMNHLRSDDFFSVKAYPVAVFDVKKVEAAGDDEETGATHIVTGDLTIKGLTHPVTFPATIDVERDTVAASADEVPVDRTLYDIRYGSGKFFKGLGDNLIYDEFILDIGLVATKK